jgi:hypothetical protein
VQQLDYNNGSGVFLRGPCRDVISKGGQSQFIVEFCTGDCEERITEKFPLLEAVARELLMKTQQAGKELADAVVISGGAVIACSSEWCIQVVNKSIHQSKPRL